MENLNENIPRDVSDASPLKDDIQDIFEDEEEVIARERREFDMLDDEEEDDGEDLFKDDFLK